MAPNTSVYPWHFARGASVTRQCRAQLMEKHPRKKGMMRKLHAP